MCRNIKVHITDIFPDDYFPIHSELVINNLCVTPCIHEGCVVVDHHTAAVSVMLAGAARTHLAHVFSGRGMVTRCHDP